MSAAQRHNPVFSLSQTTPCSNVVIVQEWIKKTYKNNSEK